ncbi:MAG: glutamate 5-kinase [Ruminococcaceae bacterium]|nr:glutamate 5-kinase [Oscillospiraceae bacterium]
MAYLRDCHRIVVKVGTSTLTHATGHLNLRRIQSLVKVISDMKNSGIEVVLVSSGAVSAGVAKLGFGQIPSTPEEKQAMSSVGQSELMKLYDKFFSDYGHTVAQILMTKDVLDNPVRRSAAENTFNRLLAMHCIPIVNENDAISTDELTKFGGNDILSAYIAKVCHADLLINMSDIDGLYDSDPRKNPDAQLITKVEKLDDALFEMAGGAGTSRGTGGMIAKLQAAKIVTDCGISMFIVNGQDPEILYILLDGGHVGTYFKADKSLRETI